MKRNYDTDDISPLMKRQMRVLNRVCDDYPAVDYYRCCGTRKRGCRIMVLGQDVAEIWADDLMKKPRISEDNVGSVCTNFVPIAEKGEAIPVYKHDYENMGELLFDRYAYHKDWQYKWSHWLKKEDDIYRIIEQVINVYSDEKGIDLKQGDGASVHERDAYQKVL